MVFCRTASHPAQPGSSGDLVKTLYLLFLFLFLFSFSSATWFFISNFIVFILVFSFLWCNFVWFFGTFRWCFLLDPTSICITLHPTSHHGGLLLGSFFCFLFGFFLFLSFYLFLLKKGPGVGDNYISTLDRNSETRSTTSSILSSWRSSTAFWAS